MREPAFWYGADGRDSVPMLRLLLAPLGLAYAAAGQLKWALTRPQVPPLPVVCVGNLSVGGAGKTPVTRAIRTLLAGRGFTVASLSRGYGGTLRGPVAVRQDMAASLVGDEPLLHAQDGLAFVARDRLAGVCAAAAAGTDLVIMDDGFQNAQIAKHVSVLVVDGVRGFGNGQVFPAGPLREPVKTGLARAQAVIVMQRDLDQRLRPKGLEGFTGPILDAAVRPMRPPPEGPLLAFAGIADPTKFFDTLTHAGGQVAATVPYPDHHPYTPQELDWLARYAHEQNAHLITTEKDWVRLPPDWRGKIAFLPVVAQFFNPAPLLAVLEPVLAGLTARGP